MGFEILFPSIYKFPASVLVAVGSWYLARYMSSHARHFFSTCVLLQTASVATVYISFDIDRL